MNKLLLILGTVLLISGCSPQPITMYAKCGETHIAYERGYITLNKKIYDDHVTGQKVNIPLTYKTRKVSRTNRVLWNKHKETCVAPYNPFHSFTWDMESGKAEYYYSGYAQSIPGRTTSCLILPVDTAPDWVVFRTDKKAFSYLESDLIASKVINDDCR